MGNKQSVKTSVISHQSKSKTKTNNNSNTNRTNNTSIHSNSHFIQTKPTTEPPLHKSTPKSPGQQDLDKLREQLAQTTVRVHYYQKKRQHFEDENKSLTPWNFELETEEEVEDTPAARMAKLRAELNSAKNELVTTKAKVHRKKIENGTLVEEEVEEEVVVVNDTSSGEEQAVPEMPKEKEVVPKEVVPEELTPLPPPPMPPAVTSFPGADFFDSDVSSDEDDGNEVQEGWL